MTPQKETAREPRMTVQRAYEQIEDLLTDGVEDTENGTLLFTLEGEKQMRVILRKLAGIKQRKGAVRNG